MQGGGLHGHRAGKAAGRRGAGADPAAMHSSSPADRALPLARKSRGRKRESAESNRVSEAEIRVMFPAPNARDLLFVMLFLLLFFCVVIFFVRFVCLDCLGAIVTGR